MTREQVEQDTLLTLKRVLDIIEANKDKTPLEIAPLLIKAQQAEIFNHKLVAILDDDQSLPEGVGLCMDCADSVKMLKANWKKVKE